MTTYNPDVTSDGPSNDYPVSLEIDYVDSGRDRLTVLFRIFTMIPIVILLGGFGTGYWDSSYWQSTTTATDGYEWSSSLGYGIGGVSLLFWPVLLMIVFQQKYPRWWFDFNLELLRFSTRVGTYVGLLTDTYPSTDEEQNVHLTLEYPDAKQLNRWLPLIKWFLAIPHYIALFVLYIVAIVLLVIGWFTILITGRFPKGIHNFLVGVTRWSIRVEAYAIFLTTDKYPPFSLD